MSIIKVLYSVTFFKMLFEMDLKLSEQAKERRCPRCDGPLHFARFFRSPVGCFIKLPEAYRVRQGLCCGHCRKRVLPLSTLFMGRRCGYRCAILIILTLRQNGKRTTAELSDMLDIDVGTLRRWFVYFRDEFRFNDSWLRLRGFVSPDVRDDDLPGSVLEYFIDHARDIQSGLLNCIRFLVSGEACYPSKTKVLQSTQRMPVM
jgi:hypothetical protein